LKALSSTALKRLVGGRYGIFKYFLAKPLHIVALCTVAAIAACSAATTSGGIEGPTLLEDSVANYGAAWAARDVDAILAQHTDGSVFHLVVDGSNPAIGKAAIALQFEAIFASNPDYASTTTNIQFGSNFVVIDYLIHMDPDRLARAGNCEYTPNGTAFKAPGVDIITFDDARVARKITYLDTETIRANSASVDCSGRP